MPQILCTSSLCNSIFALNFIKFEFSKSVNFVFVLSNKIQPEESNIDAT